MRSRARYLASALSLPLALAASAALSAPAAASEPDRVYGTRSELLREQAHVVEILLDRGVAKLVVRRTVWNGGPRHDQAELWIQVPPGAVATGLRTLGLKDGRPFWFSGELLEAEAAAAKYRELTGIGGYYPKDPALLSWRSQELLALQVFPCPPRLQKTVEYTLEMPAEYREGRYHLILPRMGTEALPATALVAPAHPADVVLVDGKRAAPGASIPLDREETELALIRRAPAPLEGGLASIPLEGGRALVRARFDAAARLSEVPRGAGVVVVLDASRSLDEGAAAASVAAARAYLSHFEDARVEVITFDREVKPLHGRLVPVKQARATLGDLVLDRRNGSAVDGALARADALLAALPAKTPRRIVVLTDFHTRASLDPEKLRGTLRSGAVLHVGSVAPGAPSLGRVDDDPWAPLARDTGGLRWAAAASAETRDAAEMARVYEELARPLRIDHARLEADGIPAEELAPLPETLDEGAGWEHLAIHASRAARVAVAGELWSRPIKRSLVSDAAEERLWSALVFGSHLLHELDEKDQMPLAMRGGAVSPVTSYLAIEPGVRPSTEGLDWGTGTGQGFGSGHGRLAGSHRARPPSLSMFDHQAWLHDALDPGWKACGGAGRAATVTLETTREEVVDVPGVRVDGAVNGKLGKCLEEVVWSLALPGAFRSSWRSWTVTL